MRPFLHRDPGLAGAALAREDVVVQIILDGVHLAEETARVTWQAARGRVALVTDAVAGGRDGRRRLFPRRFHVTVRDGVARGLDDVLAGSSLTMIEAVRNLHALGASLAEAVAAATAVPARVLGPPSWAGWTSGSRPTSSCSTTTSRSSASASEARPVSLPEPAGLDVRGSVFLAEIHEQPPPSGRSWSTRANTRAWPRQPASAGRARSGWSATARRTTPPPTASTPSASCRAGPRSATRSR